MRVFVAITLSSELKKTITGTLHDLKQKGVKGNYVPVQNLHLTLAFIGETDKSGAVKEALKNVQALALRHGNIWRCSLGGGERQSGAFGGGKIGARCAGCGRHSVRSSEICSPYYPRS